MEQTQADKESKGDQVLKTVNRGLFCVASLFLPTGIIAFRKLGQLKVGIIVYAVSIGLALATIPLGLVLPKMALNFGTVLLIFSYLMPIAVINKYCILWNKKVISQQVSGTQP